MEGAHQQAAGALDGIGDHRRPVAAGRERLVLVDGDAAAAAMEAHLDSVAALSGEGKPAGRSRRSR